MMSTRSHAVLALTFATGPLLIASTAHAAGSCGQPAKAAVHETVHHDATTAVVGQLKVVDVPARPAMSAVVAKEFYEITPAVEAVPDVTSTATEWTRSTTTGPEGRGWALTGQSKDHEAVTQEQFEWTKVTQTIEYEWELKVVTQAASTSVVHHDAVYRTDTIPATYKDVLVPAIYKDVLVAATYKSVVDVPAHTVHHEAVYDEHLYLYVNKHGRTMYKPLGWNVVDEHDNGWFVVHPDEHPVIRRAWDETVAATYKRVVDVAAHTDRVVVVAAHTDRVVDVSERIVVVQVTGPSDETVIVPEVSHYDRVWTSSASEAPGVGWERSSADRRVSSESDTVYTTGDEAAPEGYTLVGCVTTVVTPGYTEYEWARTVVTVPGHAAVPAVMGVRDVVVTPASPATAEVTHLEAVVVSVPASDETRLVSAAVPATAPCPDHSAGTGDSTGPADPYTPANGPKSASAVPATLAFTGVDAGSYLAGGLVLVFLGAGALVAARRRQDAY